MLSNLDIPRISYIPLAFIIASLSLACCSRVAARIDEFTPHSLNLLDECDPHYQASVGFF
jgi:hypothetical protein